MATSASTVRKLSALSLGLAAALLVHPALGAEPTADDQAKDQARELGRQGSEANAAGDYVQARDLFDRAFAMFPVSTLGVRAADACVKLGDWTGAARRYEQVANLQVTETDSKKRAGQESAVAEAKKKHAELVPRIPLMNAKIGGPREGVTLTLDGEAFSADSWGTDVRVNPGPHVVVAMRAGSEVARQKFDAVEAQRVEVLVTIPAPPPAKSTTAPPLTPPPPVPKDRPPDGKTQRLVGWVSLGVGAAGLVVGGITTGLLFSHKSDLDDGDCKDGQCGPSERDDLTTYNTLRPISTVALSVGVVATAGGLYALFTLPKEKPAKGARVGLVFRGTRASIQGSF